MRKKIRAIAVVILLIGTAVLLYPVTQRFIYEQRVEEFIKIEQKEESELEELYILMQKYNRDIYESKQLGLLDPFSYESASFDLSKWGFEENIMGYIDIPAMDIKLPIYLGATKENMDKGAVHLSNTSLHIGGKNTNSVIAAHRGYWGAVMFQNIQRLNIGDRLTVTNFWETLTYEAFEIKIIKPYELNEILIQEGKDLVTLVTCHPYLKNYERYVVYCQRVKP